jgi:hypothetical protein
VRQRILANRLAHFELQHRLAVAQEYARLLEQRINILERRLNHVDSELANAQLSRDKWRGTCAELVEAMKENGFDVTVVEGVRT